MVKTSLTPITFVEKKGSKCAIWEYYIFLRVYEIGQRTDNTVPDYKRFYKSLSAM